ncbi:MAG: hypothetical protein JO216_11640 [Hyphomicrobiales bacterium]|nr:hypothetical protein [Hyphomicrobiales bacterium]
MSLEQLINYVISLEPARLIQTFWTVPAGIVALYFYGRLHFNSPEYMIDWAENRDGAAAGGDQARLITPTPPIFTTRRSRYNSYAYKYILILEAAFIAMVFGGSLVYDISRVSQIDIPNLTAETVQYRVVFALFALTGLLSSFPGFKDVDGWILGKLHRAAFIPADARDLAENLHNCKFVPSERTIKSVRADLTMRDTTRVACGSIEGTLESKVFQLLCLRTQIQTNQANDDRFHVFRIALARDLNFIANQTQGLRLEVKAYLREQERLVPESASNIDTYINDNLKNEDVSELSQRRQKLSDKCDTLRETICLLIAVSLFATEFTRDRINAAIREMGFETGVRRLPPLDWDAVALVTISTFVLTLAFNVIYGVLAYLLGNANVPEFMLNKQSILRFALLYTVGYAVVLWVAIHFKRKWSGQGRRDQHRPENLLIALYAYLWTVPINLTIGYLLRGYITYASFLYAVNQSILAYFIGMYIDKSLRTTRIYIGMSIAQGLIQATWMPIAAYYSPTLQGANGGIFLNIFGFVQTFISGCTIGVVFQYFYTSTAGPAKVESTSGSVGGQIVEGQPAS